MEFIKLKSPSVYVPMIEFISNSLIRTKLLSILQLQSPTPKFRE